MLVRSQDAQDPRHAARDAVARLAERAQARHVLVALAEPARLGVDVEGQRNGDFGRRVRQSIRIRGFLPITVVMSAAILHEAALAAELREILAEGLIRSVYQPIVDLDTERGRRLRGARARACRARRWSARTCCLPPPRACRPGRRARLGLPRRGSAGCAGRGPAQDPLRQRRAVAARRADARRPSPACWSARRRLERRARAHRARPDRPPRRDARPRRGAALPAASRSRWTTSAPTAARSP